MHVLRLEFSRFEKPEENHRKERSDGSFSVQKQILDYREKDEEKIRSVAYKEMFYSCAGTRKAFYECACWSLCVKIHIIKIEIFSSTSSSLSFLFFVETWWKNYLIESDLRFALHLA